MDKPIIKSLNIKYFLRPNFIFYRLKKFRNVRSIGRMFISTNKRLEYRINITISATKHTKNARICPNLYK